MISRSLMTGFAREPAGGELAVEVPDREVVVVDVELGMGLRVALARAGRGWR